MFVESLDGRRLMARVRPPTGVDPAFDGGQVTFRDDFVDEGPIATAADGSVFVGGEIGVTYGFDTSHPAIPFVVKLTRAGKVDTTFGDKGYARLPFRDKRLLDDPDEPSNTRSSFRFDQLAYDSKDDLLYVASGRRKTYDEGFTLGLTRLKADGTVDPAYGTADGTFSYTPPLSAHTGATASATAAAIDPLVDGSVVLAVDRQTTASAGDAAQQSLALFKPRRNGSRDPHYGTRGVTELLSGTVGVPDLSDDQRYTRTIRRAFFNDVRTDAHGVTRVTMRYENGVAAVDAHVGSPDDEATTGTFQVKARTVSAAGADDPSQAYAWTLFSDTDINGVQRLVTYAAPDGDRFRVLVASRPQAQQPAVLYTLRPGRRATTQVLDPVSGFAIDGLARSANGQYLAFNENGVVRLNSDFTPDRAFGVNGVGNEGGTIIEDVGFDGSRFVDSGVLADDRGGLLAVGGFRFQRFA